MKIAKLISNVRTSELAGTATNILEAYSDFETTEDATLQEILDELAEASGLLVTAIEQNKNLSKLEGFDEKRDQAFKAIYHYLRGCTFMSVGVPQEAACQLFPIIEKYGLSMTSLSYNEQTGKMNSLIEELNEQESNINKMVNLSTMFSTLKSTQNDFQKAYANYLSRIGEGKNKQSASNIKPKVLKIINEKLITYLRSQALFKPEIYMVFAIEVATAIEKTNRNIKERRSEPRAQDPHPGV